MMKLYQTEYSSSTKRVQLPSGTIPEDFIPTTQLTLMGTAVDDNCVIEVALETNGAIGILFGIGKFSFGTLTYRAKTSI